MATNSLWKSSISLSVPAPIPGIWFCKCCSGQWLERCGQKRALQRFGQLPGHGERVTAGLLPALAQHGELGTFKNCLDTVLCPVL